ncbi:MAG: NAD(P)/FAD-dependent oxidoreductase [Deltaproteobacteria bacterium]|nr:NAD(P)/FAD-dependent oxidoreductase [Deltaproteobacteria bacterium]
MRFVVIGAGMAGVLSGIRLRQAGYEDWIVYEKGDSVGGTWRENTYPGLSCDVPSHIYSYAFEPNPDWSQRFSPGSEIRRYFEGVADKYGILPRIRFNEEVDRLEFEQGRWRITLKSGKRDEADVVIAATGVLHHPMVPEIPGLDSFAGACFHSARWDHSVPTEGKRVGVIGTGSTAIQITSALVPSTAKFSLFQRTPQWIAPQQNADYTDAEKASFRRDRVAFRKMADDLTRGFHETFSNGVVDAQSEQMKNLEALCRKNLDKSVKDPVLREKLRPNYRAACKRLIMSGDFYDAIQQPNAELVTEGIERIEPKGVRTKDGRLHELDVLVLATGFRVDRFLRPMKVRGRDGVDLEDVWKDRPNAYLSISIPGFPNLFMLNGPNGPVGNFSLITIADMQLHYVLQLVEELRAGRGREISASEPAMQRFSEEFDRAARNTIWATGCRSWYLDSRGVPAVWPFTYQRFTEEMARPVLANYELR